MMTWSANLSGEIFTDGIAAIAFSHRRCYGFNCSGTRVCLYPKESLSLEVSVAGEKVENEGCAASLPVGAGWSREIFQVPAKAIDYSILLQCCLMQSIRDH